MPTSKTALGVQAYRWLVAACMGILVLLSQRTLAGIDETAKDVRALQIGLAELLQKRPLGEVLQPFMGLQSLPRAGGPGGQMLLSGPLRDALVDYLATDPAVQAFMSLQALPMVPVEDERDTEERRPEDRP